ncbi:uncharacterized protein LOC128559416 [Mercenaria mercenaria]|uniref:uncharacterized protein LOC128559416 n=1 Tax=Mercenaria mercenaria TaxID=6596 RepID=UPI00234ED8AA|nr:uncharacterized protein LOC128559416 [Mercenaria mercenaria]
MSVHVINMPILSSKLHDLEFKPLVVDIADGDDPNQVVKPDIEDDQKRWLVIGICLHSIISPALRQYIPPVVSKLYSTLKRTDQVDKQTYANYLIRYKPTNKELNYEAINNNSAIPKVKGKKDVQKYNYNVTSDADLTKLFMITSMAHYTGFDDTCDSSALLGIVINIDTFPPIVKSVAEKVRTDIRNDWAHCNFSEWDSMKYQTSFQLMHQFIRNLQLPVQDEAYALGQLTHWQTNGIKFLHGTTLGTELVRELRKETKAISKYLLDATSHIDEGFEKTKDALNNVQQALNKSDKHIQTIKENVEDIEVSVESIKNKHEELEKRLDQQADHINLDFRNVKDDVSSTQLQVTSLEHSLQKAQKNISKTWDNVEDVRLCVAESKTEIKEIKSEVKNIQSQLGSTKSELTKAKSHMNDVSMDIKTCTTEQENIKVDLQGTRTDVATNKLDIDDIKIYLSTSRPVDKVFFYPPNKISTFVGRTEELEQIKQEFFKRSNDCHMQVVCGLGGIGKTTLSVEYAWNFQTYYPGGVFWMSAETNDALEDSLHKIALDTYNVGNDAKESMRKTISWMSKLQQRWLLVIDNLDMEEIRGNVKELVLGTWRHHSRGHIIISSRREATNAEEEFHVKMKDCITLSVLTTHESLKFMAARTGIKEVNDESALCLVEELGCLPLALEQAAAHIKALSCTYKEYLDKFMQLRLQLLKNSRPLFDISKERETIRTTWQLNFDYISKQSESEGFGTAAVTLMEISAFMYADEIPLCIINTGSPNICEDHLLRCLQYELGKKQMGEILTRFSLFRRNDDDFTLSIHRSVQEVLREKLESSERKAIIFQCATRMINKALDETWSPNDAIKEENVGKASLRMWSTLALHANTLRKFMVEFTKQNPNHQSICFNTETTKLLQASAIYHSLFQRQDEALACQNQMLCIIPAVDISEGSFSALTCVKIPLLNRDRLIIQSSISETLSQPSSIGNSSSISTLQDSEILRKQGNASFKAMKYQDAIQYYSQAIRQNPDNVDPRLYSNRSLAFLKINNYENALYDANKCLEFESMSWKAYCWKALAIAGLIRTGVISRSWKLIGMAAAALSVYKNAECFYHAEMRVEYPFIMHHIVGKENEFQQLINSPVDLSSVILLLRKGVYTIKESAISKSVRIIGIEKDVEVVSPLILSMGDYFFITGALYGRKQIIDAYFENISFPEESGHISIGYGANTVFHKCYFKNGIKGCDDFPHCKGGKGCANTDRNLCKVSSESESEQEYFGFVGSGKPGFAGVIVHSGGKAFLDKCELNRCGGGGTLSDGEGSVLEIRHSVVCNMRQMGIEARNGGSAAVIKCDIVDNQMHGVNIGPKGNGIVWNCQIRGNGKEGIWSGRILELGQQRLDGISKCIIEENLIYQNGMSGLSLEGGSYSISKNRIFDNWLWGMMIKSRSTAYISNNDIFENKCGGIRIGINFSATVTMDGNTIRDHTGPGIHIEKSFDTIVTKAIQKDMAEAVECIKDEITVYTIPPIMTTRNILSNNDRGIRTQRPQYTQSLIETCCYCRITSDELKKCSKCKKAAYCSRECQKNHWERHRHLCKLLRQTFTVEMKISEVQTIYQHSGFSDNMTFLKSTTVPLPDLGKGTPPDVFSNKMFIVKIQLQKEYTGYNPNLLLRVYDQTQSLDIVFTNPHLYHLVVECGVLAGTQLTIKKLYCFASYKNRGKSICFHTETLPPFQHRW